MTKYLYTLRRLDEGIDPSPARSLASTLDRLNKRMKKNTEGPYWLEYDGSKSTRRDRLGTIQRVNELFRLDNIGPDRIVVNATKGPRYGIKKIEQSEKGWNPDNTAGTAQIDIIHGAVSAFCESKGWSFAEMGICVNKPGEHGFCNAWDAGCIHDPKGNLLPSEEIHRRIVEVATFIREEGLKNDANSNEGLPVNGVIVMEQYWETGMGRTWNHYNGIAHVSHWHVSGKPSRTGWI